MSDAWSSVETVEVLVFWTVFRISHFYMSTSVSIKWTFDLHSSRICLWIQMKRPMSTKQEWRKMKPSYSRLRPSRYQSPGRSSGCSLMDDMLLTKSTDVLWLRLTGGRGRRNGRLRNVTILVNEFLNKEILENNPPDSSWTVGWGSERVHFVNNNNIIICQRYWSWGSERGSQNFA